MLGILNFTLGRSASSFSLETRIFSLSVKKKSVLPGTQEGIKLLEKQVAMQNVSNQLQQYQSFMKPLYEGMADFSLDVAVKGFPPKKIEPQYDDILGGFLRQQNSVQRASSSKANKTGRKFASTIPWDLLDELQAEKKQME